jgi:hypothetical protein
VVTTTRTPGLVKGEPLHVEAVPTEEIAENLDTNSDGWAELPNLQRYTLRPRFWWNAGQDHSLFLTAGFVHEDREGGTMQELCYRTAVRLPSPCTQIASMSVQ